MGEYDSFPLKGKEYTKKEVRSALENKTVLGKAIVQKVVSQLSGELTKSFN
jgi:hypothetical protein